MMKKKEILIGLFLMDFCFFLGHYFVTILKFWRFQKLSMPPPESSRRDLQAEKGPGASGAQEMMKQWEMLFGTCFWWIFFLVGHCFVTILKFWRFQKLSMPPSESSRRDLQGEKGPRASGAQKNMKK